MHNNRPINRYHIDHSKNRIVDQSYCPITNKRVLISEIYREIIINHMHIFGDCLIDEFNTGEQDCNIIVRNAILSFLEKYPHFKNDRLFFMLLCYIMSIVRCRTFRHRAKFGHLCSIRALSHSYIMQPAYEKAPPDFKLFLSQLRDNKNFNREELSIYYHNCAIIANRIDNFAFLHQPTVDIDEVSYEVYSQMSILYWVEFIVMKLVGDGLLVLNEPSVITIEPDTQELIDALREGREITGPGRYLIESDLPKRNGNENK